MTPTNEFERSSRLMVSACAALLLLLITSASASAQLLLYEGFDYGDTAFGSAFNGANGGTGWTGAWDRSGQFTYIPTGLTYSNGGTLVTNAGLIRDARTTGGPNENITREMFSVDPDGTYWFSYLTTAVDDGDANANDNVRNWTKFFSNSESFNTGFGAEMGHFADNELEADFSGANPASVGTYALDGTSQLVVGQAILDSTGDDELNLWLNIVLTATEGTIGTPDSTLTLASPTFGDFFTYYNQPGNNLTTELDEIRLGSTLADVIPAVGGTAVVPEPCSLMIWGLLGLALVGFVSIRRQRLLAK